MLADLQSSPISLTVSELNRAVANTLMANFALSWVSGELSSLTRASSGHWYFTLKDDGAQVRCVMYRQRASLLDFVPKEGDTLLVRAQVSFYEPRGEFQLQVENIRKAGQGALYEAFLRVKAKLDAEGLLDQSRKAVLPSYPLRVGLVTSPQAAALADVLKAFARRAPHVQLVLYPCLVQGDAAVPQLVRAIEAASRRQDVDLLLIVRGGGSLEDLWCFNHEAVARAIAHCGIPTITGVGHETDTTIADLVADVRAATPTAAAELASQATAELLSMLDRSMGKLRQHMQTQLGSAQQRLDLALLRLKSPAQRWLQMEHTLLSMSQRMAGALQRKVSLLEQRLEQTAQQMREEAGKALFTQQEVLSRQQTLLPQAVCRVLQAHQRRLDSASKHLQLLSPQRVLDRGFALVTNTGGHVVSDATTVGPESLLQVKLSRGALQVLVQQSDPERPLEQN
jgi:exodeoxyribonuclease VII large subunit